MRRGEFIKSGQSLGGFEIVGAMSSTDHIMHGVQKFALTGCTPGFGCPRDEGAGTHFRAALALQRTAHLVADDGHITLLIELCHAGRIVGLSNGWSTHEAIGATVHRLVGHGSPSWLVQKCLDVPGPTQAQSVRPSSAVLSSAIQ